MAFQKKIYSPPPKNKLVVEKRIIDGKMRKVETYNGKVARVYDDDGKLLEDRSGKLKITLPTPPLEHRIRQENKLYDTPPQEDGPKEESPILEIPYLTSTSTQTDEKMMSGTGGSLQIIPEDEIAKPGNIDINEQLTADRTVSNKLSTENVKEEKVDAPKVEDIPKSEPQEIDSPKIEETQKIEGTTDSLLSQQLDNVIKLDNVINIQDISNKVDIPKIEPQKEAPKVLVPNEVPKKTNVLKETQEMGIPGVPIKKMENRIEKLIDKKTPGIQTITTNDKTKVENKITEVIKAEQQKKTKENKNMVEELLEEYKREQWAKKRDFEKNIEDMARVASENKGQIKEISQQIEGVSGKVGEVEEKIGGLQDNIQERFGTVQERFGTLQERLGDMKKPVTETLGELCTGVDCIKTDLKKSQEYQQSLEKQLEGKFQELSERLHKLEEPTYICDNCGQDNIRPLSSFCSNCGAPIHSWTDPETGMPVMGWSPYWKRTRGTIE
jgi:methyl-accepting chemotaxis protein